MRQFEQDRKAALAGKYNYLNPKTVSYTHLDVYKRQLVMLILTALLAIIIIICGFFIIYTVYFRFLKILIIVPLGAIACSTMAGNRMVSHTMATYLSLIHSYEICLM